MLYVIEIRRERDRLSDTMSAIREWLDGRRFEPDAFRCTLDEQTVICRLEFKIEGEALACAEAFSGAITSIGEKSAG